MPTTPKPKENRSYLVLRGRQVIALVSTNTDLDAIHIAQDNYPDSDGVAVLIHGGASHRGSALSKNRAEVRS